MGKDGDRFQVDGESPQDLESAELVVDQEGETADGNNKKFRPVLWKKYKFCSLLIDKKRSKTLIQRSGARKSFRLSNRTALGYLLMTCPEQFRYTVINFI